MLLNHAWKLIWLPVKSLAPTSVEGENLTLQRIPSEANDREAFAGVTGRNGFVLQPKKAAPRPRAKQGSSCLRKQERCREQVNVPQ